MAKRRVSTNTKIWIVIGLITLIAGTFVYTAVIEPATTVTPTENDEFEIFTLSCSDPRSGDMISPTVKLTGSSVAYGPSRLTADNNGKIEFPDVPAGTHELEATLTGYYKVDEIRTIAKKSGVLNMDLVGTFDWGDTKATGALTADENDQVYTLTVYLNNTVDDTVIKDVRVKLEAAATHENITIDDLECTTQSFEEDDLAAEKWIISGYTIGDLDAEVDATEKTATVVVKYRITMDVGAADSSIVFTVSIQDLDGTKPKTSASKTITLTAA